MKTLKSPFEINWLLGRNYPAYSLVSIKQAGGRAVASGVGGGGGVKWVRWQVSKNWNSYAIALTHHF